MVGRKSGDCPDMSQALFQGPAACYHARLFQQVKRADRTQCPGSTGINPTSGHLWYSKVSYSSILELSEDCAFLDAMQTCWKIKGKNNGIVLVNWEVPHSLPTSHLGVTRVHIVQLLVTIKTEYSQKSSKCDMWRQ